MGGTEDVFVSHQDRLVDLRLSVPAGFLSGEEDFDGHFLSPPAAQPHLAVPTFPDLTHHLDLLGDGPLYLQEARRTRLVVTNASVGRTSTQKNTTRPGFESDHRKNLETQSPTTWKNCFFT